MHMKLTAILLLMTGFSHFTPLTLVLVSSHCLASLPFPVWAIGRASTVFPAIMIFTSSPSAAAHFATKYMVVTFENIWVYFYWLTTIITFVLQPIHHRGTMTGLTTIDSCATAWLERATTLRALLFNCVRLFPRYMALMATECRWFLTGITRRTVEHLATVLTWIHVANAHCFIVTCLGTILRSLGWK